MGDQQAKARQQALVACQGKAKSTFVVSRKSVSGEDRENGTYFPARQNEGEKRKHAIGPIASLSGPQVCDSDPVCPSAFHANQETRYLCGYLEDLPCS